MTAQGLTVSQGQEQTVTRHRHNAMAGYDSPKPEAHKSRATPAAFLCAKFGSPYNGRAVREGEIPAGPQAGLSTCTVPPTRLTAGKRSYRPQPEDSNMANTATSTGEIRPTVTVSIPTVIKRIRRKLAERGHSLLITRDNSQDRQALGRYAVLDAARVVLQKNAEIEPLARYLGVLAKHESVAASVPTGVAYG